MACFLDAALRSSKSRDPPKEHLQQDIKDLEDKGLEVAPGEWVRPLGSMEVCMAVAGRYGTYNTVQALWLSSREPIKGEDVRAAISQVAQKNHVLQMCVVWRWTGPWFRRMEHLALDFEVEEDDVMSVYYTQLQTPFNMSQGPLWRGRLLHLPQGSGKDPYKAVLVLNVHHCITDGVTNMVLCRDVLNVLNASLTETTFDIPLRTVIPALSDDLITRRDWLYVFRYFCTKFFEIFIRSCNQKVYFNGALPQPKTRVATTRVLSDEFSVEASQSLMQQCREAGVTVHAAVTALANLALFRVAQQRSEGCMEAALVNTANCINMRRYFPASQRESPGCHYSLEEKELLISASDFTSKEAFWGLAKRIHTNLQETLHLKRIPIKNCPLLRPLSILFPVNYLLTRHACKNLSSSHIITTNMGNLQHLLPSRYGDGPVRITSLLRSVSCQFSSTPFVLTFHTFDGRLMISVDYYTNKITDDVAAQFYANLTQYVANLAKFGCLNGATPGPTNQPDSIRTKRQTACTYNSDKEDMRVVMGL